LFKIKVILGHHGSPLSSIISDLVMRDLEEGAFETLGFLSPFM